MARRIRTIFLSLLLVAAAGVVALYPTLLGFGAQYALQSLQSPSCRLVWSGVRGTWEGIHIESLDSLIAVPTRGGPLKAIPVKLSATNISIRPSILSALVGQQAASFSAQIFGGSISGSISSIFSSPRASIAVSGIDITELSRFPELRALGLRSGQIEGTLSIIGAAKDAPPTGTFSVKLTDFSIPANQYTSLLKLGPQDVVSLSSSGTLATDVMTVDSLTLSSELGKVAAKGKATLKPPSGVQSVEATTSVSLTASGSERLGAWLPVMTNNAIPNDASALTIYSSSVPCTDQSRVFTMQFGGSALCFKNRFERRAATF